MRIQKCMKMFPLPCCMARILIFPRPSREHTIICTGTWLQHAHICTSTWLHHAHNHTLLVHDCSMHTITYTGEWLQHAHICSGPWLQHAHIQSHPLSYLYMIVAWHACTHVYRLVHECISQITIMSTFRLRATGRKLVSLIMPLVEKGEYYFLSFFLFFHEHINTKMTNS